MKHLKAILTSVLALYITLSQAQIEEEYEITRLDSLLDDLEATLLNESGLIYCDELIKEAEKDIYPKEQREIYSNYAKLQKQSIYINISRYERSLEYADSVMPSMSKDDQYSMEYYKAIANIGLGRYQSAIDIAQKLYEKSKEINTGTEEGEFMALQVKVNALSSIAYANHLQGNVEVALTNYEDCINLLNADSKFYDDKEPMIFENGMLKMQVAQRLDDKSKALEYVKEFSDLLNEHHNLAKTKYTNLNVFQYDFYYYNVYISYADVYCDLNQIDSALVYINKADSIINNDDIHALPEQTIPLLYDVKAKYYINTDQFEKSLAYSDSSLAYYSNAHQKSEIINTLKYKIIAMQGAKKYDRIFDLAMMRDSLKEQQRQQEIESRMADARTIYEVADLKAEQAELEVRNQRLVMIAVLIVLGAILGFVLMKRKRDKEKQRILSAQKQLLEEEVERQTHELREQKEIIEEKNRDITDSINYAQRIQKSILPEFKDFGQGMIEGAFAFLIPCNIVSGDFYWALQFENKLYCACADCTGHGVPGAFMSMIGTTILNELCKQNKDISPSELLERLHINLLAILQQSGEADSRDGMDISVLEYTPATRKVRVSAARRPVCFFINDELVEYKAAKRSIGERDYSRETLPFTEAEYDVNPGDSVYMFSDGFPDQFGGETENGKRLKYGGMVKMLTRLKELPFGFQRDEIEKMYYNWRGDCPQYDDISLLGIKF
ncbi:MAG: SpoIIE family protein phosphatase [Bacteroidales bacterium]|nr:SpoIIE family protein phosphatase [Bacteroidales bacterium]